MSRFQMPVTDRSTPVRFPAMVERTLENGLTVHVIAQAMVPAATAALLVQAGTSHDPAGQPGLASLTGDLVDEGAGSRDAIQIAEAFGALGAELEVDVGPDATSLSVTTLSRHLESALELVADVAVRPHLGGPDFERVRDLRTSRLRQLSRLPGAAADRAIATAVFGTHPYGHGSLGTTRALAEMSAQDARRFWSSRFVPGASALVVAGAVDPDLVLRAADRVFSRWTGAAPVGDPSSPPRVAAARVLMVDRPGAPQSEIRIGHLGPPRRTPDYHALVTANALVGGQFTSRINRRLREEKGLTYGARSAFDFRRLAGLFSCDSSVQADRTAEAVSDVLFELEDAGRPGAIEAGELERAKASLTRGYVRSFETATQLVRAAALLITHGLDASTFDRFVPSVEAMTAADVEAAAARSIRPAEATVVVVGDSARVGPALSALGLPIETVTPEF
jgi:predicted Zn-dependent peptidase